jgi:hypothetical protein
MQRAWLLKLAALEIHVADVDVQQQKEGCRRLLARLFRKEPYGTEEEEDGGNVLALPAAEFEAINMEAQTRKVNSLRTVNNKAQLLMKRV